MASTSNAISSDLMNSNSEATSVPSLDGLTILQPESDETSSNSSYKAPLGGHIPDPSIDGSVVEQEGIRPTSLEQVSDEDKAEALRIKGEANKLFSCSQYANAVALYTASLNNNPFDAIVWSNRAATRLKLEEFGLAIADATQAIQLNPQAVKAYFRRAQANIAIMKPKTALTDLKRVMKIEPANTSAKALLDSTQKLVRRMDFEAAISSKDEVQASEKILEQLAAGAYPIDKDYNGPSLDADNKPTEKFIEELLEYFQNGKIIPKRVAWAIVLGAYEILKNEPTMNETTVPAGQTIEIVGDTHGQYFDLLHLLKLSGKPSATHTMIFNGDFVDRGSWSTEVVLILFAYKWLYPRNVFLNRGNHETADMNKVYGFEGETKKKYSELTYKLFEQVFIALPLATLVTATEDPVAGSSNGPPNPTLYEGKKRFFVVHGGLFSKDEVTFEDIQKVDRIKQRQPGQQGLMCEMLWTDPQDMPGRGPSKRGVGIGFGPDVTARWTKLNQVTAVFRSHEVRENGYSIEHAGRLITVFSAPNYVDQVGNLAAFVTLDSRGEIKYTTFKAQPHPDIKPMAYAGAMQGMF